MDIYGDLADGLMRGKIAITLQKSGRCLTLDGQFNLKKTQMSMSCSDPEMGHIKFHAKPAFGCPLFLCQSLLVSFNL